MATNFRIIKLAPVLSFASSYLTRLRATMAVQPHGPGSSAFSLSGRFAFISVSWYELVSWRLYNDDLVPWWLSDPVPCGLYGDLMSWGPNSLRFLLLSICLLFLSLACSLTRWYFTGSIFCRRRYWRQYSRLRHTTETHKHNPKHHQRPLLHQSAKLGPQYGCRNEIQMIITTASPSVF